MMIERQRRIRLLPSNNDDLGLLKPRRKGVEKKRFSSMPDIRVCQKEDQVFDIDVISETTVPFHLEGSEEESCVKQVLPKTKAKV